MPPPLPLPFPGTLPSSWTATGAGPSAAAARASSATAPARARSTCASISASNAGIRRADPVRLLQRELGPAAGGSRRADEAVPQCAGSRSRRTAPPWRARALHRRARAFLRGHPRTHGRGRSPDPGQHAPAPGDRGQLRRPPGHRPRRARAGRPMSPPAACAPRTSTRPRSPPGWRWPTCRRPTCSSAPAATIASAISCCGSWPTPNCGSPNCCGRNWMPPRCSSALDDFAGRERRFGLTSAQVADATHPEKTPA